MQRVLAVTVALLGLAVPAASAAETSRPNVVIFLADDLGWADVPWHGSSYKMPRLESLARESKRLECHYVHPMCSPTRAALLTGRYASRFGVTAAQNSRALPFGTVTLASALKSAGYATAITGKWHLGSKPEWGPQRFGFDHGYGSLAGGCGPYDHRYKEGEFTRTWHRNGELIEEAGHITDLLVNEAIHWLESRSAGPFFLYVPFTAIHVPIDEQDDWQRANAHITDAGDRLRAACASHMDDGIGRVLAALDRHKLRDNTLVVFLSDNGAHPPGDNQGGPYPGEYKRFRVGNDNLPWRGHKTQVYEGGIRTPALVNWPRRVAPGDVTTPLHVVDWLPTLCGLAGVAPQANWKLDGRDVWPLLEGQAKTLPPRALYSAAPSFRAQMVRHGDWKLVVHAASGKKSSSTELYDLASDPEETHDRSRERPEVLAEMQKHLAEISARDGDAKVDPEKARQ